MSQMKIGQVAALAGVSVDTVRYYERRGLLPVASRRDSGYRMFDSTTVERIRLVKQLQDLSLSLDEIDGMLLALTKDDASCARESQRISTVLRRTDESIAALTALRRKLKLALARCKREDCDLADRAVSFGRKDGSGGPDRRSARS